jgi:methylenetetrahydrofolate dehydrogenase (NADP+)/methenyltetrahydrofolate cyclohydrolase
MQLLDGKAVANARREKLIPEIEKFKNKAGRSPHLTVVLVGENPASQVYVRNKVKACEQVGIKSTRVDLSATTSQKELMSVIHRLNEDSGVDGILVQLPLPPQCDEEEINKELNPLKDADGFTYQSLGYLFAGKKLVSPCTPQGVMSILEHYKISVAGLNTVVVGRSNIVGKPMAQLLLQANATVTICHSKTKNIRDFTSKADLVVVAAGQKQFMGKDDFKKDSIIVDVGIHGSGGSQGVCGDVRFDELEGWAKAATPVPGGVGPMTITTLLENTLRLANLRLGQ